MTTICPQCGSDRVSERNIGRTAGGIAGGVATDCFDVVPLLCIDTTRDYHYKSLEFMLLSIILSQWATRVAAPPD